VLKDPNTRRKGGGGKYSNTQKLINYLTDGGEERIAEVSKTSEQERKQAEIEQGAVDKLKTEIIDVGFRECSKRYHPDRPGGSEKVFKILEQAKRELKGGGMTNGAKQGNELVPRNNCLGLRFAIADDLPQCQ
jgi:hypothetical protein